MLPDIEQRLSQPDIEIFKIGKSNDSKRRFLEYEEPLHFLGIIAKGNADAINQAECDLIAHFHENLYWNIPCKLIFHNDWPMSFHN